MSLTYHAASRGTAAANVYYIYATSTVPCNQIQNYYTVTVAVGGTATGVASGATGIGCNTDPTNSFAPTITISAYSTALNTATETLTFTPTAKGANPQYTVTANSNAGLKSNASGNYTMTHSDGSTTAPSLEITTQSNASPYPTGTVFTFTSYLTHPFTEGESTNDKLITWGQTNGVANPAQTSWTEVNTDLRYKSVATWTIPVWNPVYKPTQLNAIVAKKGGLVSNSFTAGNVITLSTFFNLLAGGGTQNIAWTVGANTGNTCAGTPGALSGGNINATTTSATTVASNGSVSWTVPAYCNNANTGATPDYVSVSLDPRVGLGYTAPGVTYLTALLAANTVTVAAPTQAQLDASALRKPDGTPVLHADAVAASVNDPAPTAPSLAYTHWGNTDVRNWIRAASHVRFTATPPGGVARTIDIPIPWKITDASQAYSSPLNSTTILDQQLKTVIVAGNPTVVTYGSGLNIELDQTYKVENAASAVFTNDTNGTVLTAAATTTVFLYGVVYRPAYISWLFSGKYQNTNAAWPGYTTSVALYGTANRNYIVFDAMANNLVPGQGTNVAWGKSFGPVATPWGNVTVPQYNVIGTYTGTASVDASTVKTPFLTRIQAVKNAAINTWINHQADVFWAFRELDPANEAGNGGASTFNNTSATTLSGANPTTTHLNGLDSGWTVLNNTTVQGITSANGNSVTGMTRISYLFASSQTPLTYAVARALAQFEDPSSVFNGVETGNVSQCSNSFLMLFTDGIDNNSINGANNPNLTTPYITGSGITASLTIKAGNDSIIANPANINRSGTYWNLFTFAGIGAHLADPATGVSGTDFMPQTTIASVTSVAPSTFLPYAINQRAGVAYSKDHRVTMMTVGVSLGGQYTNSASPKASLFNAAVVGDSSVSASFATYSFNPATPPFYHTFIPPTGTYPGTWVANDWVVNPSDPADYPTVGQRAPGAVYFFDATNPALVSTDMNYAFLLAIGSVTNNATANPNLPFVGASLGNEVFIGNFQPPIAGGVIWPGDLMMFATRQEPSGKVDILDNSGNIIGGVGPGLNEQLNSSTAQWAASTSMNARIWSNRNLYTRLPSTSATEMPLTSFAYTNAALLPYVATTQVNNIRKAVIQFAAGGDTSTVVAPNPPAVNRNNIMGDVIDSAPSAVEYNFSQVSGSLTATLSAVGGNRFRLILVGTNQGWLHAFGEVTKTISDPNGDGQSLVTGAADELWAFMPTDFLANLDYITTPANTHRYMVDGSPAIYFLDLPPAGGGSGNGVVDSNERAVAVIGLGKGGRSYYALDIHNPYTPTLLWSLVPDEAANFPAARIAAGGPNMATVQGILANFGFSTSAPAFGRITFNGVVHDCVFLSGGLSEPEVEANFTGSPKLGRSVMALDVYSGQVLAAVDLTSASVGGATVGSVYAGVIPFEYILNSGMAQRAYFTDYKGGLWSWGSKAVSATAPYVNFRIDTSEITTWTMRKVFQDDNTVASGLGARYSTLPAPFVVSSFQGPAYNGQAVPSGVGIAMISGDRNNPVDLNYYTAPPPPNISPVNHQLTVVFDRQDSRALGLDTAAGPDTGIVPNIGGTNLLVGLDTAPLLGTPATPCTDAWFSVFTSSCANFYLGTSLSPKYGYYVSLPPISGGFIPKGINPPLVVSGSLFYSYFTPTAADPCSGGTGKTSSWLIADVMNPIVTDQRGGLFTPSGQIFSWTGVASNYIAIGSSAVLQGGTIANSATGVGVPLTVPHLNTTLTQPFNNFPKIRVWRDVQ